MPSILRNNKYPIKSLVKALSIVEHLGASPSGNTLTEISKRLHIGKSTVHRLLSTLMDHDFVWLDPLSSRYILGARILQLSDQLSHQSILIRYGDPVLAHLARATDETCNLGVLDGGDVLYLIMKESKNPLRMAGQVGKRLPAHCTALGKALLSEVPKEDLNQFLGKKGQLSSPTQKSISTVSDLYGELTKIRQTRLAFDDEELYSGVSCVASPVRDHLGRIIAAISISYPKNRVDAKRLQEFRSLLLESATELSSRLGSQPETQRRTALDRID